jgi:hypothetical protein
MIIKLILVITIFTLISTTSKSSLKLEKSHKNKNKFQNRYHQVQEGASNNKITTIATVVNTRVPHNSEIINTDTSYSQESPLSRNRNTRNLYPVSYVK